MKTERYFIQYVYCQMFGDNDNKMINVNNEIEVHFSHLLQFFKNMTLFIFNLI